MSGAYSWSWDDYREQHGGSQPVRRKVIHGGQKRPAGTLTRFVGTSRHASLASATMPADHPAMLSSRTRFPKSVVAAETSPRIFLSGHQNAKLGARVMKGPWRGMPIFQLSLEERATCPASCTLWAQCYGNAMPFARRHTHGPGLEARIERDIAEMAERYPRGFVVRLHVLGDFYSADYARLWTRIARDTPALRIFGYTAHAATSEVGLLLAEQNSYSPSRFKVRFSVDGTSSAAENETTVIWRKARGKQPEGIVCPAQTDGTDNCATCGLCWLPAMTDKRIAFIGHGMNHGGALR